MLNFEQAFQIASEYVGQIAERTGIGLTMFDEPIHQTDECWVFGYNSTEFIRTKSTKFALGGNAPIIVDRENGRIVETGTARPVEYYVSEYLANRTTF